MRARTLAALAGLAVMLVPATAFANGDPASDVLLQAKVYFPTKRVSVAEATKLKNIVQAANVKGYPIRVALIHDESDLGTVPNLLNQPQKYSDFLGPELQFAYKGDLLVVMPTGLGLTTTDQTVPPANALKGMLVEAGGTPDGLAQTAEEAVTKLAAASGHPLTTQKSSGGGGGATVGIIVAALLLVAGIGGAFLVRRNQPATPGEPAVADEPPAAP